jgi:hypothetical protein
MEGAFSPHSQYDSPQGQGGRRREASLASFTEYDEENYEINLREGNWSSDDEDHDEDEEEAEFYGSPSLTMTGDESRADYQIPPWLLSPPRQQQFADALTLSRLMICKRVVLCVSGDVLSAY